jgi:hypothetical protein
MKLLDTPEARNEFLERVDHDLAYHPVLLDHENIPWIVFTNEDGDVYAHSIPVLTEGTLTWTGLMAREEAWRPMRIVYDGGGWATAGAAQ